MLTKSTVGFVLPLASLMSLIVIGIWEPGRTKGHILLVGPVKVRNRFNGIFSVLEKNPLCLQLQICHVGFANKPGRV